MLRLGDINGNPYIGVYCAACEELALVPDSIEQKVAHEIEKTLEVRVIATSIASASIVGSLVAMNSHGVIATNFAERRELARLPKGMRTGVMEEKLNAAGNNILANDRAAMVNPAASQHTLRLIADVLDVEVQRGSVAGIDTVGSTCIATNKGVICHPRATEGELRGLKELFGVPASVATLNYGTPYLGACAIANSKGAYIGSRSTPIELGKLEDGLGLY